MPFVLIVPRNGARSLDLVVNLAAAADFCEYSTELGAFERLRPFARLGRRPFGRTMAKSLYWLKWNWREISFFALFLEPTSRNGPGACESGAQC